MLSGCTSPCAEGEICEVAGTSELGFNGDGLDALETRLASPTAVRETPDGSIMVVDYSNMRLRFVDDDNRIRTLVGKGEHSYSEPGVAALATPLENPVDATWGPDGLLYILPQHEGRVIRINADQVVEVVFCTGRLEDGADGTLFEEASMGYGGGMAWGPDGSLYVSDATFSRVRQFSPDGRMYNVLGTDEPGLGQVGYGPETPLRFPERLVVDGERNRLLVADTGNHRVLAMDLDTLQTTLVAGRGERGFDGDGGPAIDAAFDNPVGLEITRSGGVLVSDLRNQALRLIDDGLITTVAGTPVEPARPDRSGPPEDFFLRRPAGLSWSSSGDLLIAEFSGHRALRWVGAYDAL